MLDEKLFYSLCEKYQVEMSNKYDAPMLRTGDKVEPITEGVIKRVFSDNKSHFFYMNESKYAVKYSSHSYNSEDDIAVAC